MAYSSRVRDAFEDIITEFSSITTAGGYYNDPTIVRAIRNIDAIVEPPEIGVEMGDEEMRPTDANALVFESIVTVYACGVVQSYSPADADSSELYAATEQLRQDMKQIIVGMWFKYAPKTNRLMRWNIVKSSLQTFPVVGLGERRNKAQVWCIFKIQVRNQHADTLAAVTGEDSYGEAGAGFYSF